MIIEKKTNEHGLVYQKGDMGAYFFDRERLGLFLDPNLYYFTEYLDWFNDANGTLIDHGFFTKTIKDRENFFDSIEKKEIIVFSLMQIIKKDRGSIVINHVGNVSISNIDFINSSSEISIYISSANRGLGFGLYGFEIALNHAFRKMNIQRVYGGTTSLNKGMRNIFDKLGFKGEGVSRQAKKFNNISFDVLNYSILADEYFKDN